MEVYMDDMLGKTLYTRDHLAHLKEMFDVLPIYNMKLNLNKCVFRVFLGKFLDFMVNQWGIEANLDKIKAMLQMEALQIMRKVLGIVP